MRLVRILLLEDAQGQLGSEERKARNGEQGGISQCNLLYTAVPSTSPALHCHWLLLVKSFIDVADMSYQVCS